MSAPPFFQSVGRRDLKIWGEDEGSTVVVWKGNRNWSRRSGRKRWAIRKIERFGAGRGKKTKGNARLKSIEKKFSQPAASKQKSNQEKRQIRKEAKGSHCARKCGGDRATSNAQ